MTKLPLTLTACAFLLIQHDAFSIDFVFGDGSTTVTNPAGFGAGDSLTFQGNLSVTAGHAVQLTPVPSSISLTFNGGSTTGTSAAGQDGVSILNPFDGMFTNNGTIFSTLDEGVSFEDVVSGTVINNGTITGGDTALNFADDVSGMVINRGTIDGMDHGLDFDEDLDGTAINWGTIIGRTEDGVEIENDLDGTFINWGTIQGGNGGENSGLAIRDDLDTTGQLINHGSIMGFRNGVVVSDNVFGSLVNRGTIIGPQRSGIGIGDDLRSGGSISNYGTIIGQRFGIDIIDQLAGTIFNCGVIEGTDQAGISADRTNGVIRNHGGRIQGGNRAIALGGQNGTVILSGPSHIVGNIQGGAGGGDVIRFENMRGISAAQEAQLVALAAADSTAQTTITLFGETINWINFEDVQVDASSLETYSSVLTGPGLQQFATSLDNINGLNDALRGLLKGLNDANPALLNELASNASGQGQANALQDFARNQDTRLYSLLSNQIFEPSRQHLRSAFADCRGYPHRALHPGGAGRCHGSCSLG